MQRVRTGTIHRHGPCAAAIAALLILSGCGHGSGAPDQATAREAIRVAAQSPRGRALGDVFPPSPGVMPCLITGGGPPPGVRLSGRCTVEVHRTARQRLVVRLIERWGHAGTDPGPLRYRSVQDFLLSAGMRVTGVRATGAIPPQYWR
ncbi:MAG: hypothetical protein U0Y82_01155 [Thermoleophilia bacterium]